MAVSEPGTAKEGTVASVAAAACLADLDGRLFAALPTVSMGRQLGAIRAAVAGILGDPDPAPVRVSGDRPWTLAMLAEERAFERHYDAVAIALADLFTLKVHLDIEQLRSSFAVFVASLGGLPKGPPDYRRLIEVIGRLIASCAARRIITYSAMVRERSNRMAGVVLAYPGEITALCFGAGLSTVAVRRLTGSDPGTRLSPMIVENAAALVRRQPAEAAARFRELLQLTTPWA
jgi:hypothetical protein